MDGVCRETGRRGEGSPVAVRQVPAPSHPRGVGRGPPGDPRSARPVGTGLTARGVTKVSRGCGAKNCRQN